MPTPEETTELLRFLDENRSEARHNFNLVLDFVEKVYSALKSADHLEKRELLGKVRGVLTSLRDLDGFAISPIARFSSEDYAVFTDELILKLLEDPSLAEQSSQE